MPAQADGCRICSCKPPDKTTDKGLWALAAAAMIYSLVRFAEAYGLWNAREWAEWFALLSGAMYLPWEAYSLMRHPHPIKWVMLLANVAIVVYMVVLARSGRSQKPRRAARPARVKRRLLQQRRWRSELAPPGLTRQNPSESRSSLRSLCRCD